ncbi:MAG: hypothetical protein JST98_06115 [Bacteroidetes bacterium]|nr:hypothetical protein [Bacteroidota bacterium]
MEVHDFILGDDLDLTIVDGDFERGESTLEHQRDILLATKGSFRQVPDVGVGVVQELLNDAGYEELRRTIQGELEKDGMAVQRLRANEQGEFELVAPYVKR